MYFRTGNVEFCDLVRGSALRYHQSMLRCGSCGAEAIDGFSFCHECGAPLVKNGGQFRPSPPTRMAVARQKRSLAEWTSLGLAATVRVLYWWVMPFSVTFGGKLTSVLVVGGLVFVLTYNSKPTAIVKTARLFAKVFAVCAALSIAAHSLTLRRRVSGELQRGIRRQKYMSGSGWSLKATGVSCVTITVSR